VNIARSISDFANRAVSIFLPYGCPGCDRPGERLLCGDCESKIARIGEPYCRLCGRPLPPGVTQTDDCRECRDGAVEFDRCRSALLYRPPVEEMVRRFKFRRNFTMGARLRDDACERARRDPDFFPGFEAADALVPVPLHPFRRLRRGFNQSEFFADGFREVWGKPVYYCLARVRNTAPQSRLPPAERAKNVRGAFVVKKSAVVEGKRLVLIDDVMTTGATVNECAKALKKAGAAEVFVLTVARRA